MTTPQWDPLTAAISQPCLTTTTVDEQQQRQAPDTEAAVGKAAVQPAAHVHDLALGRDVTEGLETSRDSDPGEDVDSDSKLSPVSSPRAASPLPPSQPIAVPASGSSGSASHNGSSAALSTLQQGNPDSNGASTPTSSRVFPPDPDLNPEMLEQLLQKASPAINDSRFSMAEFLSTSGKAAMTTAARRELVGGADQTLHKPATEEHDVASSLEDAGHAADLERQASHLEGLIQAVAEESKVNRELAGLLVERMEASRRAVECLMRLLVCLMEAEAAYSTAMTAAAKTASGGPLTAPSDSCNLSAALEGLVALPAAAAAGHRQLYIELQILSDAAKGLWRRYSAKAKDLNQSVHTVQRGIDGCCKQLMTTLSEHRAACQAFDAAVVWQGPNSGEHQQHDHRRRTSAESASPGSRSNRSSAGGAGPGAGNAAAAAAAAVLRPRFRSAPTQDPWMTEGKLVAEQQALKRWQDQERQLLQQGYETLQVLEAERVADLLKAGQTLAASYPAAVESLPPAAEELRSRLGGVGGAGEVGLQSLAQVAAEMRATSEALALRQSESLAVLSQELFCSPDIIRQGIMDLWNGRNSSWGACHFVLTRAGFLHWFKDLDSTTPLEAPLNLSRCEFEAGQAPAFNLVESGSGSRSWLMGRSGRKVTLKASSVEECCEWAIALRESIALSSSTGGPSSSHQGRF